MLEDIMYNTMSVDIEKLGFKMYYNELAKETNIHKRITPPDEATAIFVGCGKNSGGAATLLDVGIMVKPEELFDPKPYQHRTIESATRVRTFHTYDDTSGDSKPMGFTKDESIWLQDVDIYDCKTQGGEFECEKEQLDPSRVSYHTEGHSHSYSMYRCGIHTKENVTNFMGTYRLVFYYLD